MRILVIPCFNEEARLKVTYIDSCIAEADCKVVLVEDGSTDGTLQLLQSIAASRASSVTVLALSKNAGKAEAVRCGILYAFEQHASVVGFCDADFAVLPTDIARLFKELDSSPNLIGVLGSRIGLLGANIQRSHFRHYTGRIFASFASIVLGETIYDSQCGAKVFRHTSITTKVFSTPFISRWGFDLELIGRVVKLAKLTGVAQTVREMPLESWEERSGSSFTIWRRIKTFTELFAIYQSLKRWPSEMH